MKKNKQKLFSILILLFSLFFMPTVIHAAAFTTWTIITPLAGYTFNPGDDINVKGTITSTVCSNSLGSIPVTYTLGTGQTWTDKMEARGGATLNWYNKITLPTNTPCGPNTLNIYWEQPVYKKGSTVAFQTDVGDATINIVVGTNAACGSAANTITSTRPSTGLCNIGSPSNVVGHLLNWQWYCYANTTLPANSDPSCNAVDADCYAYNHSLPAGCGTNAQPNPKTYPKGSSSFSGTFCLLGWPKDANDNIFYNPPFPTSDNPISTWYCLTYSGNVKCQAILGTSGGCF